MAKKGSSGGTDSRRRSRRGEPTPELQEDAKGDATPSAAAPRRTGRQTSAPKDSTQKEEPPKTAPARGRVGRPPRNSSPGNGSQPSAKAATTGQKGRKRTRLGLPISEEAEPSTSKGRSLRKRASVSFKETSDAEDDNDTSSVEGSDVEEEEVVPEIVDDTVYKLPKTALVPPVSVLTVGREPATTRIAVPASALGDLTGAYALIRSFSWQLRLSPFPYEDFCAAMCASQPTTLMDEVHVCILRALAIDEVAEERAERKLDISLLDHLTWPCYVWEWLRMTEDPLGKYEWYRRVPESEEEIAAAAKQAKEAAAALAKAAAAAAAAKPPSPPPEPAADDAKGAVVENGDAAKTHEQADGAAPMEVDAKLQEAAGEAAAAAAAGPSSASAPAPAAAPAPTPAPPVAPVPSPPAPIPRKRAFEPVNVKEMDRQMAAAAAAAATAAAAQPVPAPAEPIAEAAMEVEAASAPVPQEGQPPASESAPVEPAAVAPPALEPTTEPQAPPPPTAADIFTSTDAPRPPQAPLEYYCLPVEVKASILSRLCDHLLDCTTFHAEIDRREAEGYFVTGRGGEGGPFAIMTAEEKRRAARAAARANLQDLNTEFCVLCGVGGSLMCCDGCPAAFHMRCLGEIGGSKSKGKKKGEEDEKEKEKEEEKEWFCPECFVGGRGEAAGLRMAVAARDKWKQPVHLLNGVVIKTQLPAVKSRGRHAEELTDEAPVAVFAGDEAKQVISDCHKVKAADEIAHPSSFTSVENPPVWQLQENKDGTPPATGPEAYTNKYRNGWAAAAVAIRSNVEEFKKKKQKGGLSIPSGTCGRISVPEMPEPMTISRFQWLQMQGRPAGRTTVRCGKCHTCLRPTLRKGCLNPISKTLNEEGGAAAVQNVDTSKLSYLVAYVSRFEREFWALAEGPWASEPGGGMQFRARWSATVRTVSTAADLAQILLHFESVLRPIAFESSWFGEGGISATTAGGTAGTASQPGSRAISRATSMADMQANGGAGGSQAGDDADDSAAGGPSGHSRSRGPDPYDIRFEKLVAGGWEMDRRHYSAKAAAVNRIPHFLLRKAARTAGRQIIPGIKYKKQVWSIASPRLNWIAEMEGVRTCAQLAMAIRKLDAVLNWEAVVKPKGLSSDAPYANATVQDKRLAADGSGYEYLVETKPTAAQEQMQQQMAVAVMQQRAAMQQSQAILLQMQMQAQAAAAAAAAAAGGSSAAVPAAGVAPTPGRLGSLNQWPVTMAIGGGSGSGVDVPGLQQPQQQQQMAAPIGLPPRPPLPPSNLASASPEVQPEQQQAVNATGPVSMETDAAAAPAAPAALSAAPQPQAAMPTPPVLPPRPSVFPPDFIPPYGILPAPPAVQIQLAQNSGVPLPFLAGVPMAPPAASAAPAAAPQPQVQAQPTPPKKEEEKEDSDDEDNIGRQMVKSAIKKALEIEEEEKLLSMPAAMAAKMRSRHAAAESSGDQKKYGDKAEKKHEEKKEPPAVPQAPPGVPQGLMPFFGNLFQRQAALALPVLSWVHEKDLPLWFVRSYEEFCRREAANVAARQLQAAARRGSLAQDRTGQEAARKAAQAAAQAAADACGICSAAQGDNPELDVLWICCDTCNRWFHGGCVAMTQEDVDAIAEDETWDCPGCANARRKAERAARREGKTIPSNFSPFEVDPNKRSGRPPKPFYERADYKAGEAKMLEKLKQGQLDGSGRGKKRRGGAASETEEEAAARKAERLERLKRKKEEEARAAAEPPPPINCPVCQYPDYGRALVGCDVCHRWFHYECVGTAVEEVEAAVAEKRDLHCAECQGKRVRPPTQAAIDAAILAAADRTDLGGSKKSRPSEDGGDGGYTSTRTTTTATIGGRKIHTQATWRDAAVKILTRTMRLADAEPFCDPVSLEDVPDYAEVVSHPMDLGTLRQEVQRLTSPAEVISGVNLIVDNCVLYNGEGTDYAAAAVSMQRGFLKLWAAEGLPLTEEQWENMQAEAARRERERAAERASGARSVGRGGGSASAGPSGGGGRGRGSINTSIAALTPPPGAVAAPDWPSRVSRALAQVSRLRTAEPFLEPVPRGFMNYHDVIDKPMDLGTIAKRLTKEQYRDPSSVAADVAQVWANCRIFNERDSEVVADANASEAAFIKFWNAAGVYQGASGGASPSGLARTPSSGLAAKYSDWREAARVVLYRTINFAPQAAWFAAPVSAEEAPDYFDVIKQPMDLTTALEKLKAGAYPTPEALFAEVELIWSNAALYNGPGHAVTKAAEKTKAAFMKNWLNAGLRDPSAPPPPQPMAAPMQMHPQQQQHFARPAPAAPPMPSAGPQGQDWVALVRHVLTRIVEMPHSMPFMDPLNDQVAPGYSQVVQRPMGFGTILKNLGRGRYTSPAQVLGDIKLIFENCRTYFKPSEQIYSVAQDAEAAALGAWVQAGLPGVV